MFYGTEIAPLTSFLTPAPPGDQTSTPGAAAVPPKNVYSSSSSSTSSASSSSDEWKESSLNTKLISSDIEDELMENSAACQRSTKTCLGWCLVLLLFYCTYNFYFTIDLHNSILPVNNNIISLLRNTKNNNVSNNISHNLFKINNYYVNKNNNYQSGENKFCQVTLNDNKVGHIKSNEILLNAQDELLLKKTSVSATASSS